MFKFLKWLFGGKTTETSPRPVAQPSNGSDDSQSTANESAPSFRPVEVTKCTRCGREIKIIYTKWFADRPFGSCCYNRAVNDARWRKEECILQQVGIDVYRLRRKERSAYDQQIAELIRRTTTKDKEALLRQLDDEIDPIAMWTMRQKVDLCFDFGRIGGPVDSPGYRRNYDEIGRLLYSDYDCWHHW